MIEQNGVAAASSLRAQASKNGGTPKTGAIKPPAVIIVGEFG
jgi:hypothetical protein